MPDATVKTMTDSAGCTEEESRSEVQRSILRASAWPNATPSPIVPARTTTIPSRLPRQHAIDPAQQGVALPLRRRRLKCCRSAGATDGRLARARRQVLVYGRVAQFRHEVIAATLGHESRYIRAGIAEVAEVAGMRWAGRDAGGHAIDLLEVLVVDAVDAQRAFLHRAGVVVILARAVWAGPGAELAANAQALVDEPDPALGALVGGPGRADLDAGRLLAMQTRAREMHGSAIGAIAGLEGMHAIEPHAQGFGAIGLAIGQRRHVPAGVPLLA